MYVRWNDVSQERFFGVPSAWSGDALKVKLAAMIARSPESRGPVGPFCGSCALGGRSGGGLTLMWLRQLVSFEGKARQSVVDFEGEQATQGFCLLFRDSGLKEREERF